MNLFAWLDKVITEEYQRGCDALIAVVTAPTIEDKLKERGYENVDEFWNDSFSLAFHGGPDGEIVKTIYFKEIVDSLDDFDSIQELETHLNREYDKIRHRLLNDQLTYLWNHG